VTGPNLTVGSSLAQPSGSADPRLRAHPEQGKPGQWRGHAGAGGGPATSAARCGEED
jgi:hypothetical protein